MKALGKSPSAAARSDSLVNTHNRSDRFIRYQHMLEQMRTRRPSFKQVWSDVKTAADDLRARKEPVFTLTKGVRNFITDVKHGSIGRRSDDGVTNVSRVTRGMMESLWNKLNGRAIYRSYLYFTPALLLKTCPHLVEHLDGELRLKKAPETLRLRSELNKRRFGNSSGGEGPVHRALKMFIFENPDLALRALGPRPFTPVTDEYVFRTGDRVDVVLIDGNGHIVLVEVKPQLFPHDLAPFAQAAKYKILWSILEARAPAEVRCVVAAPSLRGSPYERMAERHGVEAVAVRVPRLRPR